MFTPCPSAKALGYSRTDLSRCTKWAATCGFYTSAFNGQKYPRIQLRTIEQLMAGVAMERPSGNVAVDETFKRAPKAKGKATGQDELGL